MVTIKVSWLPCISNIMRINFYLLRTFQNDPIYCGLLKMIQLKTIIKYYMIKLFNQVCFWKNKNNFVIC